MSSFKPTKYKIIFSIIILITWGFLIYFSKETNEEFKICATIGCDADYSYLIPFLASKCGCTSLNSVFLLYIFLLFPSLMFYLIQSIVQYFRSKKKLN